MHEVSIAEEIREIVLEKAKEYKAKKVTKITLVIGELTSIVPDALLFAFEVTGKGTKLEGAEIEIEPVKMKAECKNCGKNFRVKDFNYICPGCGSTAVTLTEGKELIIKTLEME